MHAMNTSYCTSTKTCIVQWYRERLYRKEWYSYLFPLSSSSPAPSSKQLYLYGLLISLRLSVLIPCNLACWLQHGLSPPNISRSSCVQSRQNGLMLCGHSVLHSTLWVKQVSQSFKRWAHVIAIHPIEPQNDLIIIFVAHLHYHMH